MNSLYTCVASVVEGLRFSELAGVWAAALPGRLPKVKVTECITQRKLHRIQMYLLKSNMYSKYFIDSQFQRHVVCSHVIGLCFSLMHGAWRTRLLSIMPWCWNIKKISSVGNHQSENGKREDGINNTWFFSIVLFFILQRKNQNWC